jgi:cell division septation protein DedD
MTVRVRLPLLLCALLLGALCAFAVACGDDDAGLLSAGRAERLHDDLDAIGEGVAAGRCNAVRGRLDSLRAEVERLPRTTDERLVRRLQEGVAHLAQQAPRECDFAQTTETTPTTPETTPTTPETPETTPQTTETEPPARTQEPPQTTTTPSPQPEPQPTTPTPTTPAEPGPGDAGGAEAPSGSAAPGAEAP